MILLLSLFWNFYSRASYEARPKSRFLKELKIDFYSRASYEARLAGPVTMRKGEVRISTHAPHTRRDIYYGDMTGLAVISTHAPHTRRDWSRKSRFDYYWPISTHAPHTRRDLIPFYVDEVLPDFYSRASYEARRVCCPLCYEEVTFLLTRLIRGATSLLLTVGCSVLFLLTRLIRGATLD